MFQIIGGAYQLARGFDKNISNVNERAVVDIDIATVTLSSVRAALSRADHFRFDTYRVIEAVLVSESALSAFIEELNVAKVLLEGSHPSEEVWGNIHKHVTQLHRGLKDRMDRIKVALDEMDHALKAK